MSVNVHSHSCALNRNTSTGVEEAGEEGEGHGLRTCLNDLTDKESTLWRTETVRTLGGAAVVAAIDTLS